MPDWQATTLVCSLYQASIDTSKNAVHIDVDGADKGLTLILFLALAAGLILGKRK